MDDEIEFQDEKTLYQFVFDVPPSLPLYKSLGFDEQDDPYSEKLLEDAVQRLGLSPGQQHYLQRLWSGIKANFLL